jgi:nuclear pore complex protein Nup155
MESYDKITKRAMEYGSPLARAAAVLMDLEDVGAVVDLCLATASNFGGRRQSESEFDVEVESGPGDGILSWERDLYHRHQQDVRSNKEKSMSNGTTPSVQSRSSGSRATRPIVSGADVTARDALRTCHAILFHHLTRLLSSSQNLLAERMISVCTFSTDENFLHSLFRHLQNTNHEETLLRIDSPHLEAWLHEKNTQADGSHFLLWRYYTVQKRYALAGEVMWKCASDSGNDVTLDERIECLTRANNSYTAALAQSSDEKSISYDSSRLAKQVNGLVLPATRDGIQRMLIQINETLEVASLQRRILHTVSSSSNHQDLDDSAFKKLTHSLIPVSDLYNEYSGPLCLYDVCLLIMQSCHYHEVQTIETLWKSILLEEILPIATRSEAIKRFLEHLKAGSLLEHESISLLESETHGVQSDCIFENGDWIPVLKSRVVNLGKELYGKGADYTFPLEFIVKTLEGT